MNSITTKTALGIIIGIAALAAGFFARQGLEQDFGSPEAIVKAAVQNITSVKSGEFNGSVTITPVPSSPENPDLNFTVSFNGKSDGNDPLNPKFSATFVVAIPNLGFVPAGTVKLDVVGADQKLYLKLSDAPIVVPEINEILNRWIMVDLKSISEQYGTTPPEINQELLDRFTEFLRDAGNANLLKISKTLPSEAVDGASAHHFELTLNKEAIIAFTPRLVQFAKDVNPEEAQNINQDEIDQVIAQFAQVPEEKYPTIEVWIDKNSQYFKRIKIHLEDVETYQQGDMPAQEYGMIFDAVYNITKINEPVVVTTPSTFTSHEELYEELTGEKLPSLKPSSSGPQGGDRPATANELSRMRDIQRSANVNAILNAIGQNMADNRGVWTCPGKDLPAYPRVMSSNKDGFDIASCIVPTYLPAMPYDPLDRTIFYYTNTSDYNTGYTVQQIGGLTGRVTIDAPLTEVGSISVTR